MLSHQLSCDSNFKLASRGLALCYGEAYGFALAGIMIFCSSPLYCRLLDLSVIDQGNRKSSLMAFDAQYTALSLRA